MKGERDEDGRMNRRRIAGDVSVSDGIKRDSDGIDVASLNRYFNMPAANYILSFLNFIHFSISFLSYFLWDNVGVFLPRFNHLTNISTYRNPNMYLFPGYRRQKTMLIYIYSNQTFQLRD